ncbi:MAG: DUF4432 family protein [Pseudomonadota bacterium]
MHGLSETDLRRRSLHLRALADIRLVEVIEGEGAGGRLLELRTPAGLALDLALDRGGDILRLAWKGTELGWHSATGAPQPWPSLDGEEGLGFLRGFDGFLVTCGLDHHGPAAETPADHFNYPLRRRNHHPLHGRIMASRAELLARRIDWQAGVIRVALRCQQASVFGEVLELSRQLSVSLEAPELTIEDEVQNLGFRPVRHGLLYHVNLGYPLLDAGSRLMGEGWELADRLDRGGAVPSDDHVEEVDVVPSPAAGQIGLRNPDLGLGLMLDFDPAHLPKTALWRAFQSGTFALGLEPQTEFGTDGAGDMLAAGDRRSYRLGIRLQPD